MNLDTKIEVSVGCVGYLTDEVERLRRSNETLGIENRAFNRVISMMESVQPRSNGVGYSEDRMWQAKREIEVAIEAKKKSEAISDPAPAKSPSEG